MIRSAALMFATLCAALSASKSLASTKDAFDAVTCDGDVVKALVGHTIPNTPVEALEKKHAAIALKNEGGDEVSDTIAYIGWSICGKSYHVLQRGDSVTGVVAAAHDRQHPGLIGECAADGKKLPYTIFAILDASVPDTEAHRSARGEVSLHAVDAWRIDAKNGTFAKIDSTGVECSGGDIFTEDGAP